MNELVLVYNFTMTRLIIFVCTIYYPNFIFLDLISLIGLKCHRSQQTWDSHVSERNVV